MNSFSHRTVTYCHVNNENNTDCVNVSCVTVTASPPFSRIRIAPFAPRGIRDDTKRQQCYATHPEDLWCYRVNGLHTPLLFARDLRVVLSPVCTRWRFACGGRVSPLIGPIAYPRKQEQGQFIFILCRFYSLVHTWTETYIYASLSRYPCHGHYDRL